MVNYPDLVGQSSCSGLPISAEETEAPPEGGEMEEEAPAEMEEVTLVIWDFGGNEFAFMDNIAIPEFEEKFPNIKVEHVGVLEDEMGLKLETAIAAGEVPDLAIFVPNRVKAAGHVLALDDFMARDGICTRRLLQSFPVRGCVHGRKSRK